MAFLLFTKVGKGRLSTFEYKNAFSIVESCLVTCCFDNREHFSFSSRPSAEYKSILLAKSRRGKGDHDELAFLKLCVLQSWARQGRSDTSINLFTVALLSKWLRLLVIMALNILRLFNRRSQVLHSRRGFDSFHCKDDSKIFHAQPWRRCEIILLPSWGYFYNM